MNNLPLVSRDEIDAAYRLASRLADRLGNEFAQGAPIHLSAESANTLKTWWGALPGLSASAHQFLDEQVWRQSFVLKCRKNLFRP